MTIVYRMSRELNDLGMSPFAGASLDDLAASFTDAPSPEYDGPVPQVGQRLQGVVRARDPRKSSVGPKAVAIPVWVTAHNPPAEGPIEVVETSGRFFVIGPDGRNYGQGATRGMAEGMLAWVQQEPGPNGDNTEQ